jgi:hypothetical protein
MSRTEELIREDFRSRYSNYLYEGEKKKLMKGAIKGMKNTAQAVRDYLGGSQTEVSGQYHDLSTRKGKTALNRVQGGSAFKRDSKDMDKVHTRAAKANVKQTLKTIKGKEAKKSYLRSLQPEP